MSRYGVERPDGRWPPGSLLGALSHEEQAGLVALGTRRSLGRGEILVHEGATDRTAYLLLRGCLKVLSTSASGDSSLLAVRLAGEMVGELAAMDGQPRSATVTTASRAMVTAIGHERLVAHLDAHPTVRDAVHRSVAAKLRQATRLRSDITSASVLVRLARVLAHLGLRYGLPVENGVLLDLRLTQPELAALIGSAEASVQRAFADLRRRELVRTGYRQILLRDIDRLAALDSW